jgi:uncharacterized protein DUF4384
MRIIVLSSVVVLLSFLILQALAEEKGAKAIFYSGEGATVMARSSTEEKAKTNVTKKEANPTVPKVEKYMGVSYWIDLLDMAGEKRRVDATRSFKSGDRIKLSIEANRDGYLYVINIGSTGQSHVLFPHPGVNSNFVTAWTPYEIPYNTYMRFDENPGEELLLVMLSPKPMGDVFTPPVNRPLNSEETQSFTQLSQAKGAKDIVLEDEPTGLKPASYVVAPMSSLEAGMITLQIKLRHN